MKKPINDIWKDPMVQERLKEGWHPRNIAVLSCPKCGRLGYYNEGSSFYCRFCRRGWRITSEMADEAIRLDETVTITTDGYNNETLANPRD